MDSAVSAGETTSALQQEARDLAIVLARVLAASSFSEQEKAAWATLLPEMRLDQLSRFAAMLDTSVNNAANAEVADVLAQTRTVLEKYAAMQAETDNDFMTNVSKKTSPKKTPLRQDNGQSGQSFFL